MKCGSTTCRNYDGTCDGGRILENYYKAMHNLLNFQESFLVDKR